MSVIDELKRIVGAYGGMLFEECLLRKYSTIGIGGMAGAVYQPLSEVGLEQALERLKNIEARYFLTGNGSNVLFPDRGFDGAVIRLNSSLFSTERAGRTVTVSSGLRLSALLNECMVMGLSGLECLSGIPATVGGAIKNNASARGGGIAGPLRRILVLTSDGKRMWFESSELREEYRALSWPGKGIILRAVFDLSESSSGEVRKNIKKVFLEKLKKQPCEKRSLGCVFKNPVLGNRLAWELIDEAGMRGSREGGAAVSEKHANFIVNEGGATSGDVIRLMNNIRSAVNRKFNLELEEEIEILSLPGR
ncbi:MAG: UDP-N-acetylmuramate dehydrogenase [Candidatus Omnitrophota bacterium]